MPGSYDLKLVRKDGNETLDLLGRPDASFSNYTEYVEICICWMRNSEWLKSDSGFSEAETLLLTIPYEDSTKQQSENPEHKWAVLAENHLISFQHFPGRNQFDRLNASFDQQPGDCQRASCKKQCFKRLFCDHRADQDQKQAGQNSEESGHTDSDEYFFNAQIQQFRTDCFCCGNSCGYGTHGNVPVLHGIQLPDPQQIKTIDKHKDDCSTHSCKKQL